MKNISKFFILCAIVMVSLAACKKDKDTGPYYEIEQLSDLDIGLPHQINIMFQVRDKDQVGIAGLTSSDFVVKENGKQVGSESQVAVKPSEAVGIVVKTILLMDNSASIDSVREDIKAAAIALVNQKPDYQQMAILTFSSNAAVLQELTADKRTSTMSTNLHGALVFAGNMMDEPDWEEEFSFEMIKTSNLICFGDGDDTQGLVKASEAISALQGKKVYMLGLGNELDEDAMKQFGEFYPAENIEVLQEVFGSIQADIESTANSYYWLYYQSPKRGGNTHILRLELAGNSNKSKSGYIEAEFNSGTFTD